MASRLRCGEQSIDPRVHPSRDHSNGPPSASSHPPGGDHGGEPEMLEEWRALDFDVDSSLETQP